MAYNYQVENSLVGLFFAQASRFKGDVFLRAKLRRGLPCDEWIDMTWSDVVREVRRMGGGLIDMGVEKEDRVAIFAHNRPRWIVSELAIQGSGAIGVPIYPTSTDDQLAFILNDCGAKGVVAGEKELMEQVLRVKPKVPSLEFIASMEPLDDPPDACVIDYDDLQAKGIKSDDARKQYETRRKEIGPDDIASIIYTSGTTGEPKGVVLDQSNFKAQTEVLLATATTQKLLERGLRLTSLCFLPLCHIMGRASDYHLHVALGTTITFAESYNKIQENLLDVRPQFLASVPRLYEKVHEAVEVARGKLKGTPKKVFEWGLKAGDVASDYMIRGEKMPTPVALKFMLANILVYEKVRKMSGLDRLVVAGSGGGALSKDVNKFFRSMNIIISEGFGLTETTSAVSWNGPDFRDGLPDNALYRTAMNWLIDCMVLYQGKGKNPFRSPVGAFKMLTVSNLLVPKLLIKPGMVGPPVRNTEIKIAPDGEVLVKGAQVFKRKNGYYKRPDLTDEVFTEDGFFMTGDIGEFDADGFLKITDRKKELLVTAGGKNIAPHPIELAHTFDTFVEQVCAVGDAKKYIAALVVPQFELLEKWAEEKGISYSSNEELIAHPEVIKLYEEKVKRGNENLARYEQVKKFRLLPAPFAEETGELTPTMKMKRRVICDKFNGEIESLY